MATKLSTSLLGRSVKLGMNMEQRIAQINAWRQANPGKTFTSANQPPELAGKILVRDDYQKHAGKLGEIVSVFLLEDSPRYTVAVAGDLVELGPNEFELVRRESDETGPCGRCDTCGAPCDGKGCTRDRSHCIANG